MTIVRSASDDAFVPLVWDCPCKVLQFIAAVTAYVPKLSIHSLQLCCERVCHVVLL